MWTLFFIFNPILDLFLQRMPTPHHLSQPSSPNITIHLRSSSFRSLRSLIFDSRQRNHCCLLFARLKFNNYFIATNPWITIPFDNRLRSSLQSHPKWHMGECELRCPHCIGQGTFYDYYLWKRTQTHIWHPNTESTSYFADFPKVVLCILLNS